MSPAKFKEIREKLGLTQEELSIILGVSTYKPISHYETGFRTPSLLVQAVMSYFDSLSIKEAMTFIEDIRHHMAKVKKSMKTKKP